MLVTIVAIANADNTGLDLDRLEKVEDLPEEVGRVMLQIGTARKPSHDELAAYHKAQAKDDEPYDNGGTLPVGMTEARNITGQDEVIQTPERAVRTAKKPAAPAESPTDSTQTSDADGGTA